MIKIILKNLKFLDKKIIKIMLIGFKISLIISLLACYVLTLYNTYPTSHITYLIGLSLFRLSLICFSSFLTCGFAIGTINI